jgi:hypothetical protein
MSTQIIGGNPGYSLEKITNYVGSPTTSHNVELTIDMATSIVNTGTTTRQIQKNEVIILIDLFKQYLERLNWPIVSS